MRAFGAYKITAVVKDADEFCRRAFPDMSRLKRSTQANWKVVNAAPIVMPAATMRMAAGVAKIKTRA